jgi:hypothetical protein
VHRRPQSQRLTGFQKESRKILWPALCEVKTQGDGEDAALLASGLITLAAAVSVADLMLHVPVTLDFSSWYAAAAMTVPLGILALGVWGFWRALGGQKLIGNEMLD